LHDDNKEKAYLNYGGLYASLNLDKYIKESNDKIYDKMDYYLIAEYLLENIEMDIIYKITYITIQNTGNSFENDLKIEILQRSLSSNKLEIVKCVLTIFFLVNISIEYIFFVKDTRKFKNDYNKWMSRISQTVTLQAKKTRDILLSKNLRFIYSLFTPSRILLYFIINFAFSYLAIIAESTRREWSLFNDFEEYSNLFQSSNTNLSYIEQMDKLYSIKNEMSNLSYYKDFSKKLAAVLIYFGSLRIILSMNLGVYYFLISTLFDKTLKKNFTIIILILLILPTFVFYGYLIFGTTKSNYNNIGESFFINFVKIFSFEDDISFHDQTISSIYTKGFAFSIILMIGNLFVSIMNYSYLDLKSNLYFPSNQFSWIKVILFPCNRPKKFNKSFNKENITSEINDFTKNKFINEFDPQLPIDSVEDFTNREMEKMKFINNGLYWLNFSTREMKIAYDFNNVEVSSIDNNKYNNLDKNLLNIKYYTNINFKMEIINSIEKEILDIKEYCYKSKVNFLFKNSKENNKNLKELEIGNDKELLELEYEIKQIIFDIEDLRKLNKEIKKYK
jgi:hypothetical protein